MSTDQAHLFTEEEKVDCKSTRIIEYTYEWSIKQFNSIVGDDSGRRFESPIFTAKSGDGMKWKIIAYPKGYDAATNGFIICHISLETCLYPSTEAKYKLYFLDPKGNKKFGHARCQVFNHGKSYPCTGPPMMTARGSLIEVGLWHGDEIRIACDIITTSEGCGVPNFSLADDFGNLLNDKRCSDFEIEVQGRKFSVHKLILSARSSVFAAMFETNMKERSENRVEIPDMEVEVFEEMLRFIYTGTVHNLEKYVDQLLIAADEYDLDRLKALCEDTIYAGMDDDNAADILILADLYNAQQLKQRAIKYVNSHMQNILNTDSFNTLAKQYPHLIMDILGVMCMDKTSESK